MAGKITLEINEHEVKIVSKNCAKLDEAIALKSFLHRVKDSGVSVGYLERYLGIKFAKVDNACKLDGENGT